MEKVWKSLSLSFSLSHIEVEISVKTKWIESWIFGPFFCFWKREMFERFLLVTILRLQSFYLSWQITVDQKCSGELRSGSWYLRWELMIWDGNKIFFSLRVRLKSSRAASLTRNWLGLEMVKKFIKNWLCTPSRFVSQLGMEMCRVSIPSYCKKGMDTLMICSLNKKHSKQRRFHFLLFFNKSWLWSWIFADHVSKCALKSFVMWRV